MKRKDIDIDKLLSQYFKSGPEPSKERMEAAKEPILRRIKAAAFADEVKKAGAIDPLTPLDRLLLQATCLLDDKGYGMLIHEKAEEIASKPLKVSAVYTGLERLEERGLVTSRIDKKRFFKLTAVGEYALAHSKAAADLADDALGDLA